MYRYGNGQISLSDFQQPTRTAIFSRSSAAQNGRRYDEALNGVSPEQNDAANGSPKIRFSHIHVR